MMIIEPAKKSDYKSLITIWEASVRATHHFISEEYLQELKPLVLEQYFAMVDLVVAKSTEGGAVGF